MRKLTAVLGNSQKLDGGAMFGNAPRALWSRWLEPDDENRVPLRCRALLVEEPDGRRLLFETGIGSFFPEKMRERFGVVESEHVLLQSLKELGLSPDSIDVVVLSHLHFDHAGGLLSAFVEGEAPRLVFERATFVVGAQAWERANNPHFRDRRSFIPELQPLLEASGRLEIVPEGETSKTLGPDYVFHVSHGHTPGLLLAEIPTDEGPVVFAGDLIPGTPWVHLPITMGYDRYPELLIDEKQALLSDLVARGGRLFFTHDPEVAMARVACDERGKFSAQDPLAAPKEWPAILPDLPQRPRRNRKSEVIRSFHRETRLGPEHFIYPLFVHEEGDAAIPIASMPGCMRHTLRTLQDEIERARGVGVNAVVLFPKVPDARKTPGAEECYDAAGLIPRAITTLKERWPDLCVVTDVALDPYSSAGHDGLVSDDGRILNDETIELLCKQALCQARAGADVIAPSDMMDGRVGAIRAALDGVGFTDVSILSYTAKYASAYYGPFRDALDSAPRGGDKKTYQMDPANAREALREVRLDEAEGADMLMVKPAGAYLDIIRRVREATSLPVAAYQVSGEYAMIKAACERGWLDEKSVALEALTAIRRAGADVILTYYARQAAEEWLNR